jgi:hypothetical protein
LFAILGLVTGCSSTTTSSETGYDEVDIIVYERCLSSYTSFAEEYCADKEPVKKTLTQGAYDPIDLLEYEKCLYGWNGFYEEYCADQKPVRR